jgi:sugar transferase EpsL
VAGTTPHILIVDDDELALKLVKLTIQRAGHKTSSTSTAAEALKIVKKEKIDVVIADIAMPDVNGLDLLKSIKDYDRSLPVILLTSSNSLDDAIKAIRLGVHDYLKKPSSVQEIQDSIKHAMLERARLQSVQPEASIVIKVPTLPKWRFSGMAKRLFDLLVSLLAVILLSPVMAIIYIAVRIEMGSPVIFRQPRPGQNGKPFTLYKFRTMMVSAKDQQGKSMTDTSRITPLGTFLRKTSLDELPELINVLQGNMSLVGPRPLLMAYLDRYPPHAARRHEVKPGITGWAQINGRNVLSWEKKFELDVWYVDNRSLWLDIKILVVTVMQVLKREGISHPQRTTMPEFVKVQDEELDLSLMLKKKSDPSD